MGDKDAENNRTVTIDDLSKFKPLREPRYDYPGVTQIRWHPHENIVSFTTSEGEVFIYDDFVSESNAALLDKPLQAAPFIHDPLSETSGNVRKLPTDRVKARDESGARRQGTPNSLDDILGSDMDVDGDGDDFVSDDDGAGYLEGINRNGKRTNGHLHDLDGLDGKRRAPYSAWQLKTHKSFQPGSTPWRGNRKYLCQYSIRCVTVVLNSFLVGLNLTGFVWTVDQDTHHTVTVEFHDREYHRDFHFTDPFLYDKACLGEFIQRLSLKSLLM